MHAQTIYYYNYVLSLSSLPTSTDPCAPEDLKIFGSGATHQLQWTASLTSSVTGYKLCTDVTSYCLELPSERTSYTFPTLCNDIFFTVAAQSADGNSIPVGINYTYDIVAG